MPPPLPVFTVAVLHLLVAYYLLAAPFMGRGRVRDVERRIAGGDATARIHLFRSIALQQGALVALLASLVLWGGLPAGQIGLGPPRSGLACAIAIVVLACLFVWSGLRLRARAERVRAMIRRRTAVMVPTTQPERVWFGVISLGSGVNEELFWRGLLFYYVARLVPAITAWELVLVTSAAFGFAHLYQGAKGVLLTGAIGAFLALVYVASGNLLLPVVLHSLVNLRLVFLPPDTAPPGQAPAVESKAAAP
jgi:membrane protease YdiL (CAAX protease family)